MGQGPSYPEPPIIDVGYEELTYQMLEKEMRSEKLQFNPNRPQGVIQRVFMDFFGSVLIYAACFVVCDAMRTMKTGNWTNMYWMFLGPWNALTGAPLLHKITHIFDAHQNHSRQLTHCENAYNAKLDKCDLQSVLDGFAAGRDCRTEANMDYFNCYLQSGECQSCIQTTESETPWGKQVCRSFDDAGITSCGNELPPNFHPYELDPTCDEQNRRVCINYPDQPSIDVIEANCMDSLGYSPQN